MGRSMQMFDPLPTFHLIAKFKQEDVPSVS